ncbi:matrixin family metalloprotease [Actinoallomurus purpureus]|uniref:matrixin family metalloprotease n=1 Tax=Actinoallomurus purpureus TaxID=478114 RepID=UPI002093AAF1|nr:matrixin family metalloprotease [Actinoallomurus purpureus]MCO6007578.1 matrixin family metalloprotease [Actinoallomurus purpureus]
MRRLASLGMAAAVAVAPVAVVAITATPAHAYCLTQINRWKYDTYTLYGRTTIPRSWDGSIKNATRQWNGIRGSKLKYAGPYMRSNLPNPEYTISRIDFASVGLPDVAGITLGVKKDRTHTRHFTAAVELNSRFKWNTSGTMNQGRRKTDVWTVAVHEMGHASGLSHPWACDGGAMTKAEKASVMNVTWTKKRYPNSDDKAGIAKLY